MIWQDRVRTDPTKRKFIDENGNEQNVNIEEIQSNITQSGTPVNATTMNNIEKNLGTYGNDTYDSTATYQEGNVVTHNALLYRAKQDIETPEEWTEAHWEETSALAELSNTSGNEVVIGDEEDVTRQTKILVDTTDEFEIINQEVCIGATNPNNERTWFKKSNNLLNLSNAETGTKNGITFSVDTTAGTITLSGTSTSYTAFNIPINLSGKNTFSCDNWGQFTIYLQYNGSGVKTITSNATYDGNVDNMVIGINGSVTINKTIKLQVEKGETATTYEPYVEYKSIQVDNKTFTEAVSIGTDENNSRVWFKKGKNLFIPTLTNNGTNINVNVATVSLNADEYSFICSGSDMYFGQVKNSGEDYSDNCGTLYKVTPGETIKVLVTGTGFNSIFITKYTNSKVSLGFENIASNTASLVIPENCYYVTIRFGVRSATSGTTYTTKVMLAKTTDTLTYEPYIKPSINVDGETIYTKTDDEWELLTLTSEFKNYNNNISFRPKIKKEGNVVTIKGIISPTADITNTSTEHIMFVIPEKYRPTDMPLHQVCQASGMNRWLLIVAVGGNVTLSRYGTTEMTTAPASSWLPFTITYLV